MAAHEIRNSYYWKAEDAAVLEVGERGGHKTMEVIVWFSPASSGTEDEPPAVEDLHDLGVQLGHLGNIIDNPLGLDTGPQYASEPGRPMKVAVECVPGTPGVTASMLQRFPWGKWLTAADATRRGDWDGLLTAMGLEARPEKKRPGRKGHDLAHYQAVSKRYVELRSKGVEAPAKVMAHEMGFNENTVRGWIRRCRELALLPPGRPGRAG